MRLLWSRISKPIPRKEFNKAQDRLFMAVKAGDAKAAAGKINAVRHSRLFAVQETCEEIAELLGQQGVETMLAAAPEHCAGVLPGLYAGACLGLHFDSIKYLEPLTDQGVPPPALDRALSQGRFDIADHWRTTRDYMRMDYLISGLNLAEMGCTEGVDWVLQHYETDYDTIPCYLKKAAKHGRVETTIYLIRKGGDINLAKAEGTPEVLEALKKMELHDKLMETTQAQAAPKKKLKL